jgi:hypothetical protein
MLANRTAPNPNLQRLVDEGYDISLEAGYLILHGVPYVTSGRSIDYADMITAYSESNGIPDPFTDHTVFFTGTVPHRDDGTSLQEAMVACTYAPPQKTAGRDAICYLSNKPEPIGEMLSSYYNKLTHYVRKLEPFVHAIDPSVSARRNGSFARREVPSVFRYPNTASARAGLEGYEAKLQLRKVAIVGVGGTGSYILDGLAKTPVAEIHLYDGDIIEPHNAFRLPATLPIDVVYGKLKKTDVLSEIYGRFRSGVVSRPQRVTEANLHELNDCQFVFLAVDHGPSRGLIARHLAALGIPFIDVGIGVDKIPETVMLHGRARVTLIAPATSHLVATLPIGDDADEAVYGNIQLAELNALNAYLALIRYKQYLQFFTDEEKPDSINYKCSWNQIAHQ